MLLLSLMGLAVAGCAGGGGTAVTEPTGPAATPVPSASEAAPAASTLSSEVSTGEVSTGEGMTDESARSALAEAGLAADAAHAGDVDPAAVPAPAVDPAGQALFDDICAVCHGPDGTGRIGLDLTISTLAPDEVREVLLHGRSETQMAGFAEILTGSEIDTLVAFVTALRQQG